MKTIIKIIALLGISVSPMLVSSCADTPSSSYRRPTSTTTYRIKPRVTIRNNSYRTIMVGVRGPETRFISVNARSYRTVYLKSGAYKYAITARNTNTKVGYKYFGSGQRYNWNIRVN